MANREQDERRELFRALMKHAGMTREETAHLLHVSLDTVHAWLKPTGTAGANPTPKWAVELLAFKTGQVTPARGQIIKPPELKQ